MNHEVFVCPLFLKSVTKSPTDPLNVLQSNANGYGYGHGDGHELRLRNHLKKRVGNHTVDVPNNNTVPVLVGGIHRTKPKERQAWRRLPQVFCPDFARDVIKVGEE